MSHLSLLEWDSNFFKRKIGKITYAEIDTEDSLIQLLQKAKQEDYQLIYLFDNFNRKLNASLLFQHHGKLVDTKITFQKKIIQKERISNTHIQSYFVDNISEGINELAYISGNYSRFKIDSNFSDTEFTNLYDEWVKNSITKKIADETFIYLEDEKILGFVTVSISEKRGHIGLIAVNPQHQGKRIGSELLNQVEIFLSTKNITELQVPTQKENKLACDFYLKNKFKILSSQNIYHFKLM